MSPFQALASLENTPSTVFNAEASQNFHDAANWPERSRRQHNSSKAEHEILSAIERERQRLGRDLHDDLCQQLTGIEFLGQALARHLREKAAPEAGRAQEIARLVREAITHTRELAHGLSPMPPGTAKLSDALSQLAERTRKLFQIDCCFHRRAQLVNGENSMSIHLYRIAQEAVTNAIKHGKARRIDIGLARKNGNLVLTVKDFGIGMSNVRRDESGLGLHAMKYRAQVIGGVFSVGQNPRGGTVVICEVAPK